MRTTKLVGAASLALVVAACAGPQQRTADSDAAALHERERALQHYEAQRWHDERRLAERQARRDARARGQHEGLLGPGAALPPAGGLLGGTQLR